MVLLVVRVKVGLRRGDREVETSALANSGYESETPQVLMPIKVAELLSLWPPAREVEESVFETAGGPLRVWIASRAVKIKVVAPDADTQYIDADAVVSPIADEVLLSDKMISELGLALEDVGKGHWRFMWEPKERVRRSEPPKYWR